MNEVLKYCLSLKKIHPNVTIDLVRRGRGEDFGLYLRISSGKKERHLTTPTRYNQETDEFEWGSYQKSQGRKLRLVNPSTGERSRMTRNPLFTPLSLRDIAEEKARIKAHMQDFAARS